MQCNIKLEEFYNYDLQELDWVLTAYRKQEQYEMKQQSIMNYTNAVCQVRMLACLFSKDATMPEFEEVYGWLFNDDEERKKEQEINEQREAELQVERFKAQFLVMVDDINKNIEEKKNKENK